ncbi:hypothetical protein SDC9_80656 [bioreactor metagenome]|uniref:Uncharacterized protein n=1 Tax=bioreactor metagenome TaxID=1076179 RepID=A0A644YZL7_9ZZZZ
MIVDHFFIFIPEGIVKCVMIQYPIGKKRHLIIGVVPVLSHGYSLVLKSGRKPDVFHRNFHVLQITVVLHHAVRLCFIDLFAGQPVRQL